MKTKEYVILITHVTERSILELKAIGTLCQAVEFADALYGDVIEIRESGTIEPIVTIDRRG